MKNKNIKFEKYSKSSAFYIQAKENFFKDNDVLLKRAKDQNQIYVSQSLRTRCKLCKTNLSNEIDFSSHGVDYSFCEVCTHLNGHYEDSAAFINSIYIEGAGKDYSNNYLDTKYLDRVREIYIPKVDFLLESTNIQIRSLLDVGCGGGHFVFASLHRGIEAKGIDVNQTLIDFGNSQITRSFECLPLKATQENDLYNSILNSDVDVISALAIFEHLREPTMFFDAFKKSSAKVLYYSVPLFSLSVILENVFSEVFPRHLSGGHTNLFTENSLLKLNELLGVEPIAEWRFGTDFMDLYRSLITMINKNGGSKRFLEASISGLKPKLDELQFILDKAHFCSQIHCVAKKI